MARRKDSERTPLIRVRFLRRLVWFVLAAVVVWALYGQIGDRVLLPIAERQIHELTGAEVTIGHLEFSGLGAVRMRNLRLRSRQAEHGGGDILRIQRLDGRFSLSSIALLRPRLKHLTLEGFEVNAQYDANRRAWNLDALQIVSGPGRRLPVVRAKHGTLRLQRVRDGEVTPLAVANVSGSFAQAGGVFGTYSFTLKAEPGGGLAGSELRGLWKTAPAGRLVLSGRLLMEDTPIYGNAWNLHNLQATVAYDDATVTIEQLQFDVGRSGRVRLDGTIEDLHERGAYDLHVSVLDGELARGPAKDCLVYNEGALAPFPRLAGLLERFKPEGRGDIQVALKGALSDPASVRLDGVVLCRDVTALDQRFPYRLEHLRGRLLVTEDSVVLDELKGSHGAVDLVVTGRSKGHDEQVDCDIRLTSPNMRLDTDLYEALNDRYQALWTTFSPEGTARIDYHLRREPGRPRQARVNVELMGAHAVYEHFPYPLENLTGRVVLEPDQVTLEDVISIQGPREIRLNGRVTEIGSPHPKFNITIDANSIPIDETLMAAMPARQRPFYDSFQLQATTDVRITVFPNEVGRRAVEYIAWAVIRDASVAYEKFPMPLSDVFAKATLTPDLIILEQMQGRHGQGEVRVSGKIWPITDRRTEMGYCLRLEAERLELKPEWMACLPDKARRIIERLHPTGQVNIEADLNRLSGEPTCADNCVRVECLGNGLTFDAFPYPVEGLTGRLTITPDRVEARELRVRDIVLGPTLASALEGKARQMFDTLKPGGHVELIVERAVYDPNEGPDGQVDFVGEVRLFDGRLGPEGVIDRMEVRSRGHGRYLLGRGLIEAGGRIEGRHLAIKGRSVENFRAEVHYDPNDGSFSSRGFRADCYGGTIMGDAFLHRPTTAGIPYTLDVLFDNVAFKGLASQQWVDSGQTSPERPGWASGAAQIRGRFGDPESHLGRLSAGITQVEVARRSLIGKVIAAVQFNDPTDYVFNKVEADAYLKGNDLVIERVHMVGSSLVMEGRGRLDLERMRVALVFTVGRSVGPETSFLGSLATALGSAMVRVEVRGDIDEPQITTDALPLMTRPLYMLTPEGK